jgi:hypothetical protein
MKDFDEEYYGWISPKSPPSNNNDVVVLIWNSNEELFHPVFGYYENKKWRLANGDRSNIDVKGWLNLPYYPKKS